MRPLFLDIIAVLVLVGSVTVAAGQNSAAAQEKTASTTPRPVTCDALLQHPLAWWLGSMPTSAERDQLAACLRGSGQQAPAPPSVPPAPSAAPQNKPANWNTLNADDQATWYRLAPKTWAQMTEQEHKDWYRILAPNRIPAPKGTAAQTAPSAASQGKPADWNMMSAAQQEYWRQHGTLSPSPRVPLSSPVPLARWTADTCQSEHQSLLLLSERVNQSLAQLQSIVAVPPGSTVKASPTYRCDSDSSGSQTTTTCRPDTGYSPGAGFVRGMEEFLAKQEAEKRWTALAAQVQTQQSQFDTRFREWESHCGKR